VDRAKTRHFGQTSPIKQLDQKTLMDDASTAARQTIPPGASHPTLRFAFDYWLSKAPDGLLPGRQHIDPMELRSILPNVMLIDVEPDAAGPKFRLRLIGTAITEATGRDLTGQYFGPENQSGDTLLMQRLIGLVETGQPYFVAEKLNVPDRQHMLHRLVMPLARDGKTIDMIFACCVVERLARTNRAAPITAPVLRRL
jgi:hypothetical protein